MKRLMAAICVLGSACVVGAPPGFSDGDRWAVPLVAPLENDVLMVPVFINDEGPYLFQIDPDSRVSAVDAEIQKKLDLYTVQAPEEINEADHKVPVYLAEVKKLSMGDLDVERLKVRVIPAGSFWSNGRAIRGILGRDVIADSLIFSADRDSGMVYLATQGHLKPPPGATRIGFDRFYERKLSSVMVNQKKKVSLHLDLGARFTMLWPQIMQTLKLPALQVRATLLDEFATERRVERGGLAAMVEVDGLRSNGLMVLPYADKRVDTVDYDGALGQNFFSQYHVTVNWHEKSFWLKPRSGDLYGTASERLRRWGGPVAECGVPACVEVEMVAVGGEAPSAEEPTTDEPTTDEPTTEEPTTDEPTTDEPTTDEPKTDEPKTEEPKTEEPGAESPPGMTPRYELRITRSEPGLGLTYEVLLDAVDEDGRPLGLPRLLATLREGQATVVEPDIDPAYRNAASFVVLDISPVGVRSCAGEDCVWPLPTNM